MNKDALIWDDIARFNIALQIPSANFKCNGILYELTKVHEMSQNLYYQVFFRSKSSARMNTAGIYELFNNCAQNAWVKLLIRLALEVTEAEFFFIESSVFGPECQQN